MSGSSVVGDFGVRCGLFVWIGLSALPEAHSQSIAGPIVSPVNGHHYHLLAESSWQDAEATALGLNGHLATVRSAEEQAWVFGQFGRWGGESRSLWIGLRRAAPGGSFGWVSGEPLSYSHWLPGQPDDSPVTRGENHVHMINSGNAYGHPGGFWNDLASPNSVFTVFNPVCGVVEVIPPRPPEVRLAVVQDPTGWLVRVQTPVGTVRLVWEVATVPGSSSWSVADVQSDVVGRTEWTRTWVFGRSSEFLRVRAHATAGFNARLDRLILDVRATHPEAVLLEANPVLSSVVTELPEWAGLRAVLRVDGGTVVAEQTELWGDPRMEFRAIPWMGDMDLPWPVAMDLEEAESALRDAGFGSEYRTVTLRRPVYPGMTEPYFIFGTPAHGFVFVGTVTRRVFPGN